jgi:hypothetical protein
MANKRSRTTQMLRLYRQVPNIDKNMALTSFFTTTGEDITNADTVEIDIERTDEHVAPVLKDISTGSYIVSQDIYTGKNFKPPAYSLKTPFNAYDLFNVDAGMTEYENEDFQTKLRTRTLKSWVKLTNMIKRGIEIQASQILQSGTVDLPGKDGVTGVYQLDFKPKTTHFPTVSTAWSNAAADIIGDLDSLGDVIRDDGLVDPEHVIMDALSWRNFIKNTEVLNLIDKRNIYDVAVESDLKSNGLKSRGFLKIGQYEYQLWTYNGKYKDPATGNKLGYMQDNKVIMTASLSDLDFRKVFAGVPTIIDSDPRFSPFMPSRVVVPGAFSFKPRVYIDENEETLFTEVKSRPLLIPTSIDRYGCLTTTP